MEASTRTLFEAGYIPRRRVTLDDLKEKVAEVQTRVVEMHTAESVGARNAYRSSLNAAWAELSELLDRARLAGTERAEIVGCITRIQETSCARANTKSKDDWNHYTEVLAYLWSGLITLLQLAGVYD